MKRFAVIVDGAYLRQKMCESNEGKWPDGNDIYQKILSISDKCCEKQELFRIFYYDAFGLDDGKTWNNPVDGSKTTLLANINFKSTEASFKKLKTMDNLAFRYGFLGFSGWKLKNTARFVKKMQEGGDLKASDFTIDVRQKGVDMKIGLDIAWLSMRRIVDVILIVTADSDFVPAMKLARKEGLQVYLAAVGQRVKPDIQEHCDKFFMV